MNTRNANTRAVYLLAAISLVFASTSAGAVEEQRSLDASADGHVSISNIAGSVEVSGWSRNEVDVLAELGSGVEELIVERDGDSVIIQVKADRNSNRGVSSDLVVRVPEGSSIDVTAVSADIQAKDVRGEQRLHAVSGDITTNTYAADLEVEAVSGDIEVVGDSEQAHTQLTTVSGDIDTAALGGDIEISTVSGDVVVANGVFRRVQAETVNGDLTIRAALADGGRMDVETINGKVDLHFTGEVSGRFDIETFNGSIDNCFGPDAVRTSRYTPGRELKFTEGEGDARITVQTLNGRLNMCRD